MIEINGTKLMVTKFPNNEVCVPTEDLNTLNLNDRVTIMFKWESDQDLIHLYFVLLHLQDYNIRKRDIHIQYLPYSRMDRNQNGNCFTLYHLAKLLNSCTTNTDTVYLYDVHSSVSTNLILNSVNVSATPYLYEKITQENNIDVICYPDKGAKARFSTQFKTDKPVVFCEKVRDFATGQIQGLELVADVDLTDKDVLIIDDLSSKGGTFYFTALKLKEAGVRNIYLSITHCEEAIKYGKIWKKGETPTLINHIYTTDSMLGIDSQVPTGDNITVYSLKDFIYEKQLKEI